MKPSKLSFEQNYSSLKSVLMQYKNCIQTWPSQKYDYPLLPFNDLKILINVFINSYKQKINNYEINTPKKISQFRKNISISIIPIIDEIPVLEKLRKEYPNLNLKLIEAKKTSKLALKNIKSKNSVSLEEKLLKSVEVDKELEFALRNDFDEKFIKSYSQISRLRESLLISTDFRTQSQIIGITIHQKYRGNENTNLNQVYANLITKDLINPEIKDTFIKAHTGQLLSDPIFWLGIPADLTRYIIFIRDNKLAEEILPGKHYWTKYIRRIFVDKNGHTFKESLKDVASNKESSKDIEEILRPLMTAV